MSQQTYLKVPFVWEEPKPSIEIPSRLKFKAARTLSYEVLLSAVAQVMESSIDASDRKQVVERGSRQAAEQFLSESKDGFLYQDEWWQIGFSSDDRVVGFESIQVVLKMVWKKQLFTTLEFCQNIVDRALQPICS
ncbi:hypothetical protein [Hyella patelloides]|nr:hypothetical protein [Hyella patelloides]